MYIPGCSLVLLSREYSAHHQTVCTPYAVITITGAGQVLQQSANDRHYQVVSVNPYRAGAGNDTQPFAAAKSAGGTSASTARTKSGRTAPFAAAAAAAVGGERTASQCNHRRTLTVKGGLLVTKVAVNPWYSDQKRGPCRQRAVALTADGEVFWWMLPASLSELGYTVPEASIACGGTSNKLSHTALHSSLSPSLQALHGPAISTHLPVFNLGPSWPSAPAATLAQAQAQAPAAIYAPDLPAAARPSTRERHTALRVHELSPFIVRDIGVGADALVAVTGTAIRIVALLVAMGSALI